MAYAANVPDLFVGMNDAVVEFEISLVANGFFDSLPALGLIFRTNSLHDVSERRWGSVRRDETQHAIALLRIVCVVGHRAPGPAAGMAEPLRFRKICFTALQSLLGGLALRDVGREIGRASCR